MRSAILLVAAAILFGGCEARTTSTAENSSSAASSSEKLTADEAGGIKNIGSVSQSKDVPKTVRDFFMLLPEKYFTLEGCEREKDKDCRKAREDYLKEFAEVDIGNGYIRGGCDGGQACIEMAIFKRPDSTYLVGVATFHEMSNDYYFLVYNDRKWQDVSSEVVPQFSKTNMYEMPRRGTTVQVFAKKIVADGPDFEASEKGKKLYDLLWMDGKFSIKK